MRQAALGTRIVRPRIATEVGVERPSAAVSRTVRRLWRTATTSLVEMSAAMTSSPRPVNADQILVACTAPAGSPSAAALALLAHVSGAEGESGPVPERGIQHGPGGQQAW
ncbi:hypothetical protein [Actinoplanes sp. NBRC 103695]|uniref:hypothetical protein n=1 Tax=Actinoplanes sp. NBRC 103695 TaxID=3032202 RepID=UPI0024A07690|nr:hypothetical protein [Actinoplanes sp. NBRC 103695]GLZ00700.1 hypothetical protein Acsp02_79520 [Actinoplanes sp. NBRC 103695]